MPLSRDIDSAFEVPEFRLFLSIVAVFLASYGLAILTSRTGDLIQGLITQRRPGSCEPLLQRRRPSPGSGAHKLQVFAAAGVTASHTLIVCFRFLAGDDEYYSGSALAKDAENVCVVFLAIEAIAAALVGVIWIAAKAMKWCIGVRGEYSGWYEGGIYD